ncbi:hypothetical protein AK830_g4099 [Neonectria ditissima]|uniref:Uncharacterized protein n=1 Tax=Neonectria ditissima TaxID=78410 RepID=A0A0P7AWS3_9HYPO|nr:hypothetical protein AK830_g4099 [Neonectria ditissima]
MATYSCPGMGDKTGLKPQEAVPSVNVPTKSDPSSAQTPISASGNPPKLPPRCPCLESLCEVEEKLKRATEDLAQERRLHTRTKDDLQRAQMEVDALRKVSEQTEIGTTQLNHKGLNQLTDYEITQKARQLRDEIRNVAVSHFDLNKDPIISQSLAKELNGRLRLPEWAVEAYLRSSATRPAVIQAYLWAFLGEEIFNYGVSWAPEDASLAMRTMTKFILLGFETSTEDNKNWLRKYCHWRAKTSTLVSEAMNLDGQGAVFRHEKVRQLVQKLSHYLRDIASAQMSILKSHLYDIVFHSMDLQEKLSRQFAYICWETIEKRLPYHRDVDSLRSKGRQEHKRGDQVMLVLVPGLAKVTDFAGDDSNAITSLMTIEVAGMPQVTEIAGGKQKR